MADSSVSAQEQSNIDVQGSALDQSNIGVQESSPRVELPPGGNKFEDALPASLEFSDERENDFLSAVILETNPSQTQFNLSPTYTLYLAIRFRLSSVYRPDLSPTDRAPKLTTVANKIAQMIHQAIQDNRDSPAALAFWMANASEVLHFFKQDRDIHPFSMDSQEMLAEAVKMAFHHLVRCLEYDLERNLSAFLDENDDDGVVDDRARFNRNKPTMIDILDTLSSAMNLLRRCRVNAALTIQLFSQLFHFINMWVFNILVTEKRLNLCTRVWGMRLKRRLGRVEAWAQKQELELAADCHLCRIIQAAHLLQAPKSSPDDIANISSTCLKLNSLQLRELLERYINEPNEPPIPHNLIDRVVSVAENMADDLIRYNGRTVQLEEDQDLQLPFLLPGDGYSCDSIKGVPNGLGEFIEPLRRQGLCRMSNQPLASGSWTVYMSGEEPSQIIENIAVIATVNAATAVYSVALAVCMPFQWYTVKTIQDLLEIYGMETHIGAVTWGILVCGIFVTLIICVSAALLNKYRKQPKTIAYSAAAALILMSLIYLVFGFLSATYNCEFDDGLEMTLNNSLKNDYIDGKGMVAKGWDKVQLELSCCGVLGPKDYTDVIFNKGRYVPASCCTRRMTNYQPFNETICQVEADLLQHKQLNNGTFLNTAGCYSEMKNKFHKYLLKMTWFSFATCGWLVVCVMVTLCTICNGRSSKPQPSSINK